MALIDPKGLLYGERLGDCNDEAQLHWPRLFATSNGYGRTELSYDRLCDTVYSSFKKKPTHAQLSAWFQDYQTNFLLFIYEAPDGSIWGQWITSEKFLPKYKTSVDRQSPAPDPRALKEYMDQYIRTRKSKYLSFQSFHKSSEISGNVQKISEDFRRDVVVGVGEEESIPPSSSSEPTKSNSKEAMSAEAKQVRSAPSGKVAGTIPLNTGRQFQVFEEQVQTWAATYPAVDVRQELREIRAWCDSNPSRRKTERGVLKFINAWLAREQDKGGRTGGGGNGSTRFRSKTDGNLEALRQATEGFGYGDADGAGDLPAGRDRGGGFTTLRQTPVVLPPVRGEGGAGADFP